LEDQARALRIDPSGTNQDLGQRIRAALNLKARAASTRRRRRIMGLGLAALGVMGGKGGIAIARPYVTAPHIPKTPAIHSKAAFNQAFAKHVSPLYTNLVSNRRVSSTKAQVNLARAMVRPIAMAQNFNWTKHAKKAMNFNWTAHTKQAMQMLPGGAGDRIQNVASPMLQKAWNTASPMLQRAMNAGSSSLAEFSGTQLYLPGLKVSVNLDKLPVFSKISSARLTEWFAEQAVLGSKAMQGAPLSVQDQVEQLKLIDHVAHIYQNNPNLTAEKDKFDIAPGTHLAAPYETNWRTPFIGKGFNGKMKMFKGGNGWDDGTGWRGFLTVFHHAVYIGDGWVIHVGGGGARRLANKTFRNHVGIDPLGWMTLLGKGLYIVQHSDPKPRHQVMYDAIHALGDWNYNLYAKNCEHFATELVSRGGPISRQIERGLFVAILLTSGAAALATRGAVERRMRGSFTRASKLARSMFATFRRRSDRLLLRARIQKMFRKRGRA
jgi:hypothetical protein